MTSRLDRSGFTIMETMVASSIALIVLAAVAGYHYQLGHCAAHSVAVVVPEVLVTVDVQ